MKQKTKKNVRLSKQLKEHFFILMSLQAADKRIRQSAMQHASKEMLLAITEIARNIVRGNVPLSTSQFNELNKSGDELNELANRKTSTTRKRAIVQSGGFINLLAGPLLRAVGPMLAPLLGSVVKGMISRTF